LGAYHLVEREEPNKGDARPVRQETLAVFDDVFISSDHVLMDGEYHFVQELLATAYYHAS